MNPTPATPVETRFDLDHTLRQGLDLESWAALVKLSASWAQASAPAHRYRPTKAQDYVRSWGPYGGFRWTRRPSPGAQS
jgi:hypothetical protein